VAAPPSLPGGDKTRAPGHQSVGDVEVAAAHDAEDMVDAEVREGAPDGVGDVHELCPRGQPAGGRSTSRPRGQPAVLGLAVLDVGDHNQEVRVVRDVRGEAQDSRRGNQLAQRHLGNVGPVPAADPVHGRIQVCSGVLTGVTVVPYQAGPRSS